MVYENAEVTMTYKIVICEMSLAVLINIILNFAWAWLIIRQVVRIVTRGSKTDSKFEGTYDDEN